MLAGAGGVELAARVDTPHSVSNSIASATAARRRDECKRMKFRSSEAAARVPRMIGKING
jgi:hypothetical protein